MKPGLNEFKEGRREIRDWRLGIRDFMVPKLPLGIMKAPKIQNPKLQI
jgi:hypothetical protein